MKYCGLSRPWVSSIPKKTCDDNFQTTNSPLASLRRCVCAHSRLGVTGQAAQSGICVSGRGTPGRPTQRIAPRPGYSTPAMACAGPYDRYAAPTPMSARAEPAAAHRRWLGQVLPKPPSSLTNTDVLKSLSGRSTRQRARSKRTKCHYREVIVDALRSCCRLLPRYAALRRFPWQVLAELVVTRYARLSEFSQN